MIINEFYYDSMINQIEFDYNIFENCLSYEINGYINESENKIIELKNNIIKFIKDKFNDLKNFLIDNAINSIISFLYKFLSKIKQLNIKNLEYDNTKTYIVPSRKYFTNKVIFSRFFQNVFSNIDTGDLDLIDKNTNLDEYKNTITKNIWDKIKNVMDSNLEISNIDDFKYSFNKLMIKEYEETELNEEIFNNIKDTINDADYFIKILKLEKNKIKSKINLIEKNMNNKVKSIFKDSKNEKYVLNGVVIYTSTLISFIQQIYRILLSSIYTVLSENISILTAYKKSK